MRGEIKIADVEGLEEMRRMEGEMESTEGGIRERNRRGREEDCGDKRGLRERFKTIERRIKVKERKLNFEGSQR